MLDRRKDAESFGAAVRSLSNEARLWFEKGNGDDVYAKASSWSLGTLSSQSAPGLDTLRSRKNLKRKSINENGALLNIGGEETMSCGGVQWWRVATRQAPAMVVMSASFDLSALLVAEGGTRETPRCSKQNGSPQRDETKEQLRSRYSEAFYSPQCGYATVVEERRCSQHFHSLQLRSDSTRDNSKHVVTLGITLFKLISEALGLNPDHLYNMECSSKEHKISQHYYPACPEPELTLGATKHSDPGFLTIFLQNQIGGLQVLYQDEWIDIEPIPGALFINI
ncbi:hypothetical protein BUALT_Bualt14G0112100 [Buddleja alternifolia]|uniref:Isopenicillin N synthase-like Fe(2+) 2OG dioxygenase domain-containing protein n=1 Tax=Buddleja alternifolia TaxID=168488 RepID=A0AAV6WGX4_9LAMI|nr:hypothetical protein BUALT_Bualt14G0112100 [Buddleja alternifolia]